jgi:hypothetical protein
MKRGTEAGILGLIILYDSNVKVKFVCTPQRRMGSGGGVVLFLSLDSKWR